jgi:hypothetical protein
MRVEIELSVATVCRLQTKHLRSLAETHDSTGITVMRVMGVSQNDGSPYTSTSPLPGSFKAIDILSGDEVRSHSLSLPPLCLLRVRQVFDSGAPEVAFALDVWIRTANNRIGYEFFCEMLTPPTPHCTVGLLEARLTSLPAIPTLTLEPPW